jgi:photosystem II stability/assembly factor-like uncharacterized protein
MSRARSWTALLLTLVSCPTLSGTPAGGVWFRYPLPGAEVKSLAVDRGTPGAYYLGTAQGGIYRSTDGGRSWTAPEGGAAFPGFAVTAIAVDPVRPGTVWAGLTGIVRGGLVVRSDDHGRTFTEVRSFPHRAGARVVAVAAVAGRRVVAVGGDYGIELTEDDGRTWRASAPALDPGSGVSFLAFHPDREGVLFCGSFRHPFRSTDVGRTWTRIATGMVEDTEVFAIDFARDAPGTFWAATCGWVYRSTDGGTSWTRFKEGLTDRRTHVVRVDPRDPSRILAGTTGGLFESRDAGKSFRRIGPEMVVNALVFDPRRPNVLLIGTEAEGVLLSEDGGLSVTEANRGLAEARVSSVALTASGKVVVARAADGAHGGLWTVNAASGEADRLAFSPPSTVLALTSEGERLFAGTPDGLFVAAGPGDVFSKALPYATRAFARDGERLLAATDAGVFAARSDGKGTWTRMGSLGASVDGLWRARFASAGLKTFAADSGGLTLWWDGADWVRRAVADGTKLLTGGFGRPRATPKYVPEPIGVEVDAARALLVFRPEDESEERFTITMPEQGLAVAGWAGDPRGPTGLYLATMGRGLFRFVPKEAATASAPAPPAPASAAPPVAAAGGGR